MATPRRGTKISRCYRLIAELLQGKELDRRTVEKLVGVRVAAADKHLNAIAEVLARWVQERRQRHHRTIRLNLDGFATPSRNLAAAACLAASLAHLFRGSTYEDLLTKALDQVIGRLRRQAGFREARRKFVFVSQGGEIALPERQEVFDELVEAVIAQQVVALDYVDFDGNAKQKEVQPWSIAIYDHQLYVLAKGNSAEPSAYRLSRIRSATRRSKRFEYPDRAHYDPNVLFRDTFGIFVRGEDPVEDVELRLSPRWRTYARTHRWHASQRIEVDDSGVTVYMRVRTCRELEAFVLGFGEEAEVVAPHSLRRRIAERGAALAKVYGPVAQPQRLRSRKDGDGSSDARRPAAPKSSVARTAKPPRPRSATPRR